MKIGDFYVDDISGDIDIWETVYNEKMDSRLNELISEIRNEGNDLGDIDFQLDEIYDRCLEDLRLFN